MSIGNMIFFGLLAVIVIYGVMLYNGLVALKHNVAKAWANIDVLLKQRHDELPKLVEVCKQYKEFEQTTLQRVIEARSQVQSARETQNIGALGEAEGALRMGLGRLFAVAEAYPQLQASQNFLQLQSQIVDTEDKIQASRRFYNGGVRELNTKIKVFPNNMFARNLGFHEREFFEVTGGAAIAEPPRIQF